MALKIKKLAEDVNIPRIYFIGNLIKDAIDREFLREELGIAPIVFFTDPQAIRETERAETPLTTCGSG